MINSTYHLLYRRLSSRFRMETIERHWEKAQAAARKRSGK